MILFDECSATCRWSWSWSSDWSRSTQWSWSFHGSDLDQYVDLDLWSRSNFWWSSQTMLPPQNVPTYLLFLQHTPGRTNQMIDPRFLADENIQGWSIWSRNTVCWHQITSTAIVWTSYVKAQPLLQCQQRAVLDQMVHPISWWNIPWWTWWGGGGGTNNILATIPANAAAAAAAPAPPLDVTAVAGSAGLIRRWGLRGEIGAVAVAWAAQVWI